MNKNFRKSLTKERNSIKKQIFKRVADHAHTNLNNTANVREQITADDKLYER
jgi:hypothetical protein